MSNDLEEFLLNDNFYSGPANPTKHINNFRNSIHIKNLISSKSLNKSLLSPSEKTGFMKSSPSMKALESILNDKSDSGYPSVKGAPPIIEEEPEELPALLSTERMPTNHFQASHASHGSNSGSSAVTANTVSSTVGTVSTVATSESLVHEKDHGVSLGSQYTLHNPSVHSIQLFETARSTQSQIVEPQSEAQSTTTSHKRYPSTIDESSGYTTDDTPVLAQPATFHNIKTIYYNSPQLKIVEHKVEDDTLVEEESKAAAPSNATSTTIPPKRNKDIQTINIEDNSETSSTKKAKRESFLMASGFSKDDSERVDYRKTTHKNNISYPDNMSENFRTRDKNRHKNSRENFASNETTAKTTSETVTQGSIAPIVNESVKPLDSIKAQIPAAAPTDTHAVTANAPRFIQPVVNFAHKSLGAKKPQNFSTDDPASTTPSGEGVISSTNSTISTAPVTATSTSGTRSLLPPAPLLKPALHQLQPPPDFALKNRRIGPSKEFHESQLGQTQDESLQNNLNQTQSSLPQTRSLLDSPNPQETLASSPRRSPHIRSNSAFSLSLSKPFTSNKNPSSPALSSHRRSNTVGDIPSVAMLSTATLAAEPATSKKFSFKALFKLKSKNHLLNDPNINLNIATYSASNPKKLSSKSYSSPNISTIGEKTKPKPSVPTPSSSSGSLLNVFKKNKSVDNLTKLKAKQNKHEASQASKKPKISAKSNKKSVEVEKPIGSGLSPDPEQTLKHGISNVNFIREVSDEDIDIPLIQEVQVQHPVAPAATIRIPEFVPEYSAAPVEDPISDEETAYDEHNLLLHPPTKLQNTRFGEEMKLVGEDYGSPFVVTYNSTQNSPEKRLEVPASGIHLHDSVRDEVSKSQQLLGEALFPKSLSAQEVESIVSLERSRSMRSIKSSKRNSFINYDGNNENVIHYNGPASSPAPSGIGRSNSILKNSNSRRNLANDINNSIDAAFVATVSATPPLAPQSTFAPDEVDLRDDTNITDLMEFTDFIDVENISFSTSPRQMDPESPAKSSTSPRRRVQVDSPVPQTLEVPCVQSTSPSPAPVINIQSPVITPPSSQEMDVTSEKFRASLSPSPEITEKKTLLEQFQHTSSIPRSPISLGEESEVEEHSSEEEEDDANDAFSYTNERGLLESSPILEAAYKVSNNSPIIDENGRSVFNNRPISMSFRGMKPPAFAGKIAQHDIRSSESHQSFTLSFAEDSSSNGVGGGFGSSSEEEDIEDEEEVEEVEEVEEEEKENVIPPPSNYNVAVSPPKINSKKFGNVSTTDNYNYNYANVLPPPPKNFILNKIPSISDSSANSSPKSFSSIISRKWRKNSPTSNAQSQFNSPRIPTKLDGVRFSSRIILYDTYNGEEYDRHPDTATCNQLTPLLAQQIKDELNTFKSQMEIHVDSRCHTHFF